MNHNFNPVSDSQHWFLTPVFPICSLMFPNSGRREKTRREAAIPVFTAPDSENAEIHFLNALQPTFILPLLQHDKGSTSTDVSSLRYFQTLSMSQIPVCSSSPRTNFISESVLLTISPLPWSQCIMSSLFQGPPSPRQSRASCLQHATEATQGVRKKMKVWDLNKSFTIVITRVFFSKPKAGALTELVTPV